jgi:hypothetical protein
MVRVGYNRVDGRLQGVRVQGVRVEQVPVIVSSSAPSSYSSRFPAKGRGLEWARILCNCGRT